jgi:hypothetical protein
MLTIKGIPSKEEAIALYEKWKKERDDWNKEACRHDAILLWCIVVICILAILGVLWSTNWSFDIYSLGPIRILTLLVIPLVGFIIIGCNWRWQCDYNEFSWPLKYKYYSKTHDKTILETKLDNGVLCFVLENDKHEVTTDMLVGFTNKYRTDVDEVIIDLDNEEILIPYKTNIV